MVKKRKNAWSGIIDELINRIANAFKSIKFIFFFLFGVIFVGGIGIWFPFIISDSESKRFLESLNVFTYSVAILGTLCIESFFNRKFSDFSALGLIVGLMTLIVSCIGYYQEKSGVSSIVNITASFSLLLFVIANANDERFDDDAENAPSPTGYANTDAGNIKNE